MVSIIRSLSDNILRLILADILALFLIMLINFEMEFKENAISFLLHTLYILAIAFVFSERYTSERNRNYKKAEK